MSNNRQSRSNAACRGFSLVEVMTALSIVVIGIIGAYELINQAIRASSVTTMQLTAAYLAKEGIDIVKNIRDTNFLKIHYSDGTDAYAATSSWVNGLAVNPAGNTIPVDCTAGCGGDYSMLYSLDPSLANGNLKFDGSFYNYNSATTPNNDTPFKRKITIAYVTDASNGDHLNVVVKVAWTERGNTHSLTAMENLYDWWPQ